MDKETILDLIIATLYSVIILACVGIGLAFIVDPEYVTNIPKAIVSVISYLLGV